MASEKKMVLNDSVPVSLLTVRMIMQGKEVGSIIGKKGDNIKKFREDSGAKINISDGSCPERIVTVTGTTECIHKAFTMICKKFEEDLQNTPTVPKPPVTLQLSILFQDLQNTPTVPKPPVTLRLVVPASQCGSLIGKGGSKIKEIRETTGASIQVASEMLPNSTERAVTVSGTADAITLCIQNICSIMLESPPKGATIQYRPKPVVPPVIFAGGQAYTVPGQMQGVQASEKERLGIPKMELSKLHQLSLGQPIPIIPCTSPQLIQASEMHNIQTSCQQYCPRFMTSLTSQSTMPGLPHMAAAYPRATNTVPQALPAQPQQQQTTTEMAIPNDLIGCIIGRGGQKINEIRQMSGAMIKISNAEEGAPDRKVTITGTPETIGLAQYLINTSMELHKTLTLDPSSSTQNTTPTLTSVQSQHAPMAIPISQLAMKPMIVGYNGLNGIAGLNGISHGLNGLSVPIMDSVAAANQKNLTTKMRVGLTSVRAEPKFSPY
ncbi:poly(rC)-binding protein 3-like isoform X1 [Crassostrea angulata]|uniref:poly(rC)-binding protein 3-like isoform X1 n=1 Tax=Magallana angulata TaxID=2784310 RepID=UPI0022B0F4CE|nr:poly(rC)-binding protein 3-like isoform X1 [Crassostrea angulata]XP_052714286.1 poly(rC)-binding protein 3-like isoform X1 [Crassostrea angulata]XP_052714295.1 poly(rC)-binding protein 3-like isoform X1 [Crassostrea angulata]XP_052714302.1 poly(rC)-binding protein 3-like isoform X1 [Crassostrea angulata]XP_052714311.1 poly(rC)-binding protein 3-like isoform X1 [Crassostrea angulata]XP_052714318.1 poly(rC)-binding protein 3-like isoform X1 [Crassostrea angulata]XP_052714326.1 poly(rC)-bindi